MATGAWTFYNSLKNKLGQGLIALDGNTFNMSFHTSASNAATATLSSFSSVDNEVAASAGYVAGGKALTVNWSVTSSADKFNWGHTDVVWTAGTSGIKNVKFAVISQITGSALVCYSQLTTAEFTVTNGNTLTISSSNGVFNME